METIYFTYDRLINIYNKTIEISGGGASGVLDDGRIKSIIEHIKNDDYYNTFEEKLTHIFYSFARSHCFVDGNKRIAIAAGVLFMNLNGYTFRIKEFITEMENYSLHVASGKIEKDLLREIIEAIIMDELDREVLKLKIYDAIK